MTERAPRKSRQHNISLQESESRALRFLADVHGRHGNKSGVVGSLIAEEMNRLYGQYWNNRVDKHFEEKESAPK